MGSIEVPEGGRPVVWAMIIEDHHYDTEVNLFASQDVAESEARAHAKSNAHPDDPVQDCMNDRIRADGWTVYLQYSCEGDSVRVQPLQINVKGT